MYILTYQGTCTMRGMFQRRDLKQGLSWNGKLIVSKVTDNAIFKNSA